MKTVSIFLLALYTNLLSISDIWQISKHIVYLIFLQPRLLEDLESRPDLKTTDPDLTCHLQCKNLIAGLGRKYQCLQLLGMQGLNSYQITILAIISPFMSSNYLALKWRQLLPRASLSKLDVLCNTSRVFLLSGTLYLSCLGKIFWHSKALAHTNRTDVFSL